MSTYIKISFMTLGFSSKNDFQRVTPYLAIFRKRQRKLRDKTKGFALLNSTSNLWNDETWKNAQNLVDTKLLLGNQVLDYKTPFDLENFFIEEFEVANLLLKNFNHLKQKNEYSFAYMESFNNIFLRKFDTNSTLTEILTLVENNSSLLEETFYNSSRKSLVKKDETFLFEQQLKNATTKFSDFNTSLFNFKNSQLHKENIYFFFEAGRFVYNIYHLNFLYLELNVNFINLKLTHLWEEETTNKSLKKTTTFEKFVENHELGKQMEKYQKFKFVLANATLNYCYLFALRVFNSISAVDNSEENPEFEKTASFRKKYLQDFWVIVLEFSPSIQFLLKQKKRGNELLITYSDYFKLLQKILEFDTEAFTKAFLLVVENDSEKNENFSFNSFVNENVLKKERQQNQKLREKNYNKNYSFSLHTQEVLSTQNLQLIYNLVSYAGFLTFRKELNMNVQILNKNLTTRERTFKTIQFKLKKYNENKIALRKIELEFLENTNLNAAEILSNLELEKEKFISCLKPKPTKSVQKKLNDLFTVSINKRRSWLILKDYLEYSPIKLEEIYDDFKNSKILRKKPKILKTQLRSSSNKDQVSLKEQFPNKFSEIQQTFVNEFVNNNKNQFDSLLSVKPEELINSIIQVTNCDSSLIDFTLGKYKDQVKANFNKKHLQIFISLGPFIEINQEIQKKEVRILIDKFNILLLKNAASFISKDEKIPVILSMWGSMTLEGKFLKQDLAHIIPVSAFGILGLTLEDRQKFIERGEEISTLKTAVYVSHAIHQVFDKQNIKQINIPKLLITREDFVSLCVNIPKFLYETNSDYVIHLQKLKLDTLSYSEDKFNMMEAFKFKNEIKAEILGISAYLILTKGAKTLPLKDNCLSFVRMDSPYILCVNDKNFFKAFVREIKMNFEMIHNEIGYKTNQELSILTDEKFSLNEGALLALVLSSNLDKTLRY